MSDLDCVRKRETSKEIASLIIHNGLIDKETKLSLYTCIYLRYTHAYIHTLSASLFTKAKHKLTIKPKCPYSLSELVWLYGTVCVRIT